MVSGIWVSCRRIGGTCMSGAWLSGRPMNVIRIIGEW